MYRSQGPAASTVEPRLFLESGTTLVKDPLWMPVSRLKQFLKNKFCHAGRDYQTETEIRSLVESITVKASLFAFLCAHGARSKSRRRQTGVAQSR
jgi:hypothetical protein